MTLHRIAEGSVDLAVVIDASFADASWSGSIADHLRTELVDPPESRSWRYPDDTVAHADDGCHSISQMFGRE